MIQAIQNILSGIGEFFTSIGNIISNIYHGLIRMIYYYKLGSEMAMPIIQWVFPVAIASIIVLLVEIVVVCRVFGRIH